MENTIHKYEFKDDDVIELGTYRGRVIRMLAPDKSDYIQGCIRSESRLYENELLSGLLNFIPINPNVVDVGAYTGSSTVWFATMAGARHVTSIEPDVHACSILNAVVGINGLGGIVDVVHSAVGDEDGYARLAFTSSSNMGASEFRKCGSDDTDAVPMSKIDTILEGSKDKVDVLHISMEGYEFKALEGAMNILKRDRPVIMANIWHPNDQPLDPEYDSLYCYTKLMGKFAELGYVCSGMLGCKSVFEYEGVA